MDAADGPRTGKDGRRITVGIRPEHVRLDANGLEVVVDLIEPLGSETVLIGRLATGELLSIKVPGSAPAGDRVRVAFDGDHLHVFDGMTGLRLDAGG